MMLVILNKDPVKAAYALPKRIRHTQLKELMQMISCVVSFGYKELPQGKEIKQWINNFPAWVWRYGVELYDIVPLENQTRIKYKCLLDLLSTRFSESTFDLINKEITCL